MNTLSDVEKAITKAKTIQKTTSGFINIYISDILNILEEYAAEIEERG